MQLSKFSTLAISTAVAAASFTMVPTTASAEVSASLTLSNMYLWRGQNLTPDGPAISGSLDYGHESGFYAGIWTINETGGHETDLYAGFSGEAGAFSYDVSYWLYLYPENNDISTTTPGSDDLSDNTLSDIVLSGSIADFTATFYIAEETQGAADATYYTLDYTMGAYNILYGAWDIDAVGADEYTHIVLSYAYSDNLSFAVSKASADLAVGGVEEDPLFVVTYNVPLK